MFSECQVVIDFSLQECIKMNINYCFLPLTYHHVSALAGSGHKMPVAKTYQLSLKRVSLREQNCAQMTEKPFMLSQELGSFTFFSVQAML